MIEGSLEAKLPTRWTGGKAQPGRRLDREKVRSEKIRGGEDQKKGERQKREDAGARNGRTVAKHCVFPMFCGSGGSKVGSLKRRVQSQLARARMKNCTPLWRGPHVSNRTVLGPHVEVAVSKNARRCGAKHMWKNK